MDPVLKPAPKKDWSLTGPALDHLLGWLDEGTDSGGEKFLGMRQRLVAYFDRKNCWNGEDLADETLNRIARRLEEEGKIESETPAKYCYIVARFVLLEHLRGASRESLAVAEIERQQARFTESSGDDVELRERMLNCLERCTGKLERVSREIITQYYIGRERLKIENRRALAQRLGLTTNALSIRACRIRDKLEGCVRQCLNEMK